MKSKAKILEQFEKHYKIGKSGCKNQWRHIQECQSFYSGDYMSYKDDYAFGRGSSRRIKQVQFNRVKPYVNSVVGFMAQMRRKPDYQATLEEQQEQVMYTDYANGLSDYVRENTNADQMETRQDMDLIIGGIGVTDTVITTKVGEPTRDPNGEILEERVNPLHVGWDGSNSTYPNVLDSRFVWRAKDYDVEEAEELFDTEEEEFESANTESDDPTNYEFNPYGGIQDKIGFEWADPSRKMVRVYFYQWFEIENFYRVENPLIDVRDQQFFLSLANALMAVKVDEDEEMFRFDPESPILVITKENKAEVRGIFEEFGIPFKPVTDKRKVYYTAVLSGKKVFSAYKSVSQQGFSLKFKTGDYDEVNKIWTGLVASMRDPQKYYNKALTELMLIIANNSRGGVIYEESAVDNIQEFEAKWARTNAAVRVNDGALSGGKIQPKATPQMSTGYEGILEVSGVALSQVTGIDESFFGAIAGGNETAMLQRQRIKQATTSLAIYFDSIALYAKEQARMMLSFMRLLVKSSDGKLFKMLDEEGKAVFETMSADFFVDEYAITIGEAPQTPVQKEYYVQTLMNMAQTMLTIGDPMYKQMYAAAINHMPFTQREKAPIIAILIGEQQFSQEQVEKMIEPLRAQLEQSEGEQAQLMSDNLQAKTRKDAADAQDKLASAQKTLVEIEEVHEDVEKKAIENDILAAKDYDDVNVTI